MIKIIGLGVSGVIIAVIGLTLRLQVTDIGLYVLSVNVAALGFVLCFYSGKLYGSRR